MELSQLLEKHYGIKNPSFNVNQLKRAQDADLAEDWNQSKKKKKWSSLRTNYFKFKFNSFK